MSDVAIRVDHLGKKFRIGQKERYKTLRESMTSAVTAPFRRWIQRADQESDAIWALKDISFEVKRGEVLGIIGRNGAGKSTLLKILSRITEPTRGQVELFGRIGSLLEVGTGFHPELTGRENIYLNGAILGMKKAEITRKFDEIVAFSEIEQFLDTPVKRYSSGMYMRLAFAVAAHLEPEILVVDEVLAVGDASFQKKCLGKMGEVAKQGRTVLFVSHNMAAVENLCNRGLLLQQGRSIFSGSQTETITRYVATLNTNKVSLTEFNSSRKGSGEVRIVGIELRDTEGNSLKAARSGQDVDFYLYFEADTSRPSRDLLAAIFVKTMMDTPVFLQHNRLMRQDFGVLPARGAFVCRIPKLPLPASHYKMTYSVMANWGVSGSYVDMISDAFDFSVVDANFFGSGDNPPASMGVCLVQGDWRMEEGLCPDRTAMAAVSDGTLE